MRKSTRSKGRQPKGFHIRIGPMVSDILLTPGNQLYDREKTIAHVKMFRDAAKRMFDLLSNPPQSSENKDTKCDPPTNQVSIEDSELTNIFELSREKDDFFSFESFDSFENP
jgi:hypothetical protein